MNRTFAYGAALAQGSWPCQEDGYFVDPTRRLFAIADGFGGRGAGDLSAKIALGELKGRMDGPAEAALVKAAQSGNKLILERNAGRSMAARGGTSLIAGWANAQGFLTIVHTGACAAFLVRAGQLLPLLVPQARPREEYAPLLPTEALGLNESLRLEARELELKSGEILFLCSGGLDWESDSFRAKVLEGAALREPGASLEPMVRSLVENASMSAQGWNRTLVAMGRS